MTTATGDNPIAVNNNNNNNNNYYYYYYYYSRAIRTYLPLTSYVGIVLFILE